MPSSSKTPLRMEVRIELKPGVVDAEAESVEKSLRLLGLAAVPHVTTARVFVLSFSGVSRSAARQLSEEAVEKLLANPVIHRVTIRPATT